ncbi:MAG TPA: Hsp20/alpha crystallin family protein, partial [Myxococcota bacterium]|nr:Hsp20/alpha crystallin family protein [Myxococcota bacterium]
VDAFRPALDVCETERAIVVRVELAGVASDDARVVVDGEYLQITGRRTLTRGGSGQRHLLIEIAQGPFERVLRLRAQYDPDRVTARLEDGMLTIELPRKENTARVIPVNPS